jgi:hypothetical protein
VPHNVPHNMHYNVQHTIILCYTALYIKINDPTIMAIDIDIQIMNIAAIVAIYYTQILSQSKSNACIVCKCM